MEGTARVVLADVRTTALSLDEAVAAVSLPTAGCVVTFVGVVRNTDDGKAVTSLEYTAHPTAADVLRVVAEESAAQDEVVAVAVLHRSGLLRVEEVAVVVAVAAAHREAGFQGCRRLVDQLKASVPLWKRQFFTDGTSQWVGLP